MKELDLVMSRYLEQHYEAASSADQALFRDLLELPDPELYDLLLGRRGAQNDAQARLIDFLRGMSGKYDRES
jgi:antitoxin CptB